LRHADDLGKVRPNLDKTARVFGHEWTTVRPTIDWKAPMAIFDPKLGHRKPFSPAGDRGLLIVRAVFALVLGRYLVFDEGAEAGTPHISLDVRAWSMGLIAKPKISELLVRDGDRHL